MLFCVILRQDPRRGCSHTSQYAPPPDGGFSLIRDTQKGRKVRPSLRLVVGLNRAADCVTARASKCGFCRFRKRRHSRGRSHAYTRLRLASGSVARTRALNAPQRRTLSPVFSYAAHPVGEPPMAAYEKRHPKVSFAVVVGGYDEFAINCPNAMRGCDLRRFKCEDEGAYLAYVTEIRDTQKGRKVRPSLRLVVGLNRAADCVTARASNRTRGHLVRWKEKDICPQVFAIFPAITKKKTGKPSPFCYGGVE